MFDTVRRNHVLTVVLLLSWLALLPGVLFLLISSLPGDVAMARPSEFASATFQNSLALDGTGDYVEIAHDPALAPTSALTLEAWVRRSSASRCETILSKDYQSAYWLGFCNQTIRFYSGGLGTVQDGATAIPANVWTHIAVVWQTGGQRKYYINGDLDYTGSAGAAPGSNAYPVFIGADPGPAVLLYEFSGNIAEVRLWNVARSQDDIRHTMHIATFASLSAGLDELRPGLVAVWHLADNYDDGIGSHHGTSRGNANLTGPQAPPRPAVLHPDTNFNTLPATRYAAATAYVPLLNRALLIGGVRAGAFYDLIDAVDTGTGVTTERVGKLEDPLAWAAAAYAPNTNLVYLFGGSAGGSPPKPTDALYAINPDTGYARTLSARLPVPTSHAAAVYHARLGKIYILGGDSRGGYLASASVFDPATGTISGTLGVTLPTARWGMGAAYSAATDKIYTFGGYDSSGEMAEVLEIALDSDGQSGAVTPVTTALLPQPDYGLSAVEDPVTRLVYLVGGLHSTRVAVFDPVTGQLWPTPVQLPEERRHASVVYDGRNRHVLVAGGGLSPPDARNTIWRIPLGNGPAVPLGRWDFPPAVGAQVTTIDGDEKQVWVGTSGNGVWRYDETGGRFQYTAGALGSANGIIYDVHYNAPTNETWVATGDAGGKYIQSNGTVGTYGPALGTNRVLSVDATPVYTSLNSVPVFFGTDIGLKWGPRWVMFPRPGFFEWITHFSGQPINALAHRANGDPSAGSGQALGVVANGVLKRLTYSWPSGAATATDYGRPCGSDGLDLAFGPNGDWWVLLHDPIEHVGLGVCRIPAASTTGAGNTWPTGIGDEAKAVDVDADGRIWVAVGPASIESGGLAAYEAVGSATNPTVRFEPTNWLTAPVGSRTVIAPVGAPPKWDSGFSAVGAADERVWAGKSNGQLVTLAQRWQQLDESNDLDQKVIEGVWTVRGRAFLATSNNLHVLLPDGQTWDNRSGVHARAVLDDRQGRTWVGTETDVRLYTATGWDLLATVEGTPPAGPVYALAEDQSGRIWIGGAGGLTLFDRERFVATFTTANSNLPHDTVRALLADRDNRLWIGTDNGLARLDEAGDWTVFTTANGLPANAIHDLAQPGAGEIAVSTGGGLSLYDGTTFVTETLPIPAVSLPLTVDELGRLWAGSAVRTAGGWQGYWWTNSGLRSSTISDNAADGADRVWFSHAPSAGVSLRGTLLPPLANTVPIVTGISPDHGSAGAAVAITGSGFGASPDDVQVTIGGAPVELLGVADTTITATLSFDTISGDVSASVAGRRTTFKGSGRPAFCAEPVITGIFPHGGNNGVRVDIAGSNFDPYVAVSFEGGPEHLQSSQSPTHIQAFIQQQDRSGSIAVRSQTAGCEVYRATSADEFRHIELAVSKVVLNQGLPAYPLIDTKPTLIQNYISHSVAPRSGEQLQVDTIEVRFTNQRTGAERIYTIPYTGNVRSRQGDPSDADLKDIYESVNVSLTPEPGIEERDYQTVTTLLKRRGALVATGSVAGVEFQRNRRLQVLLVPVMWEDYAYADLQNIKANVNAGTEDLRARLMPTGWVDLHWSDTVVIRAVNRPVYAPNGPITGWVSNTVDIGSGLDLYNVSHDLDRARSAYNEHHDSDVMVAVGIVERRMVVNSSTASGLAFDPDDLLLQLGDFVLDVIGAACTVVTLGLWDGCDVDIPPRVAWTMASPGPPNPSGQYPNNRQYSGAIGHELGHTLGLVKASAPNGNAGLVYGPNGMPYYLTDNPGHSLTDELDNGDCTDSGSTYNSDKTLYSQPGVAEPVVNPITVQQLYPQLSSDRNANRGKAIMSYACMVNNNNAFFEPADLPEIFGDYAFSASQDWPDVPLCVGGTCSSSTTLSPGIASEKSWSRLSSLPGQPGKAAPLTTHALRPQQVAGQRLHVSGLVTQTTDTGEIRRVEPGGTTARLSANFATGYWLVQLDSIGRELARTGVFPMHAIGSGQPQDTGFYAATILRQDSVARIELRHNGTVLDTFQAGSAAPTVSISSPSGGAYSSGYIPVTWTATDSNGDPLAITILYSADDGMTWRPLAFSQGSGTVNVPVARLAGSANARFRVVASDGLNSGSATSPAFTVANQPPRPYIGHPAPGSTFLEGQSINLSGSADDNQDGSVTDSGLRWRSDRDGNLETGARLSTFLSVGTHTLSLQATNSAGLQASVSVTLTVEGDYDYDGLGDGEELGIGLSPLNSRDVYVDRDKDGLPLIVELKRGLNPNNHDTDGDGRSDAEEIAAGTDPARNDPPLSPDRLAVYPDRLAFSADLSQDRPLPQQLVQVVSRSPVAWTLAADVSWLRASAVAGTTVAGTTILAQAFSLDDGVHTGNLYFTSLAPGSTITVPVTITITHSAAYFDLDDDGRVSIKEVQAVAARFGSDNRQAAFSYRHDMDRDGDVDVRDIQLIARRWRSGSGALRLNGPSSGSNDRWLNAMRSESGGWR